MIELRPFTYEDWLVLDEYEFTAKWRRQMTKEQIQILAGQPHSYSGYRDGELLVCGGVLGLGGGRGEVWAMLRKGIRHEFWEIHALARRFLEACPYDRIEAVVEYDHTAGHRWVKALGFVCEAPVMRKYIHGVDHTLYARVR